MVVPGSPGGGGEVVQQLARAFAVQVAESLLLFCAGWWHFVWCIAVYAQRADLWPRVWRACSWVWRILPPCSRHALGPSSVPWPGACLEGTAALALASQPILLADWVLAPATGGECL